MTNRSLLPLLSLAVLATAVGCALPGADRCQSAEDCAAGEAALDDLLGSLPARWPAPPAERLELLDSSTTTTDDGGERVVCTEDTYVSQRTFHDLMALGDQYARVQPGMVVQGASLADGRFRAVPLPRGPVALTIELPLEEPTRALEEPSSTSLQAAVASLQRDADAELGSLPDLPARVSYSSEIVQSFEEATLAIDVSLSYSDSLRSAGLDAGFSSTDRRRSHTVIARLFQPMYTIAVADDEIATARDFFAPDLSEAAVEAQRAAGTIGPDNLPAYVHSVTYGRIVVFTMTSEEVESAEDLYAAVEGSFRGFEGDASAEASYRSVVSRSQVRVLALGGSADAALEAIRAGDYAGFFGPASASTAVPLSYEVRYLGGTREAAVIGQELEYTVEGCRATPLAPVVTTDVREVTEDAGDQAPVSSLWIEPTDHVVITATGDIWSGKWFHDSNGPGGETDNLADSAFPVPNAPSYGLIARVGGGRWFMVGTGHTLSRSEIGDGGRLVLGTNDDNPGNGNDGANDGGFSVRVRRERPQ